MRKHSVKTTTRSEQNFTEAEEADKEREKLASQVREAIRRVGVLVVVGLALGIALIVIEYRLNPEHGGLRAVALLIIRELGMGLLVAAVSVFGYELLMHVSGTVNESKKLHAGFVSLDLATKKLGEATALAQATHEVVHGLNKGPRIDGVPEEHARDILNIAVRCAANKPCLRGYEIEFSLGPLRSDGYREITVHYFYQPITWLNRKLRFRCSLPSPTHEWGSIPSADDYEVVWSFLGRSEELPSDALLFQDIEIRRGGGEVVEHPPLRRYQRDTKSVEFETENEICNLSKDARVSVRFRVLQSNEFSFVRDCVTESIVDYTARCVTGRETTDIGAIFPGVLVSSDRELIVTRDPSDPRRVSVKSLGWVLPGGGTSFSWSIERQSGAQLMDAAAVRTGK